MSNARVTASLHLDISNFQAGLEKANGFLGRFKALSKVGGAGALGGLVGVGAMIQGFRAVLERAQQARDAAKEIGTSVNVGTASVARYADSWDRAKKSIGDVAVAILGVVTQNSEKTGEFLNDQIFSRFRGLSPDQAKRTREISEQAAANAERLSTPEALAAAKKRGDDRRAAAARADEEKMKNVAQQMNEGSERRAKTDFDALPLAKQLVVLDQRRAYFQKIFADNSRSVLTRAAAFNDLTKTESEIAEKKLQREKEISEVWDRQIKAAKDSDEDRAQNFEKMADAQDRMVKSQNALSGQKNDALGFTVGDAASGKRGKPSAQAAAKQIARDEETARQLHDSGNKVTLFDPKTQRNREVGADFYQQRALDARQAMSGLTSSEQNPFAGAAAQLTAAATELRAAGAALQAATIDIEVEGD